MPLFLEQIGSELSLIRAGDMTCDWKAALHFCRMEYAGDNAEYQPTGEDDLLHDVLLKGLQRGQRPFTSYFTEQWIISLYGRPFAIEEKTGQDRGSITYAYDPALEDAYKNFNDVIDPWGGNPRDVDFDPMHPKNERELFTQLLNRFGKRLGHCTEPQVDIASILDPKTAASFTAQRSDLLLSFPNGRGLLLEPGNHDDASQINLDRRRDRAFEKIGICTLRPRNLEIHDERLYAEIRKLLSQLKAERFLVGQTERSTELLAANYLFLLPSLISRVERLLLHFFFRQGLVHKAELRVGVIERDLECAELSLRCFLERLERLARLYGISYEMPHIKLYVERNPAYRFGDVEKLGIPIEGDSLSVANLDLVLDVGIKCNALTRVDLTAAAHAGSVRQSFPHNRPVRFGYRAEPRAVDPNGATDELLSSFVKDYFRKQSLRSKQGDILRKVLSQKSTIGLLPTSAGKSLCYQLASLLTPGTTIVVDPLVALMKDQVQGLTHQFGIDRVLAWHAGAGLHDKNVGALLSENAMIFMSPERLQRPGFRSAMKALNAADIYINYAVIDEAHCVSMWGHDFRPSYLTLERNFRKFCTYQGRPPVLVALTGTASQLVLIDLKRELNILDFEAIIRPDTFDRPELNFNLVSCSNSEKTERLGVVMTAIARRLNVQKLDTDAHGIIFAYTPKEVWELFGEFVGNAKESVRTVLSGKNHRLRYGVYTGSSPKEKGVALFSRDDWDIYKDRTLSAFKRGQIQMLFGNTAVSVGIDNEKLNYVINYRMPQSMEAYYQQCGRAGRSGQRSECYLLFSDDYPGDTQNWLDPPISEMPKRWDDLGTIAYFHQSSFPGEEADHEGAMLVFKRLFDKQDEKGLVEVPQYLGQKMKTAAERTERYISYWLILGILTDYEVKGMGQNAVYRCRRHSAVEDYLKDQDEEALKTHIVEYLYTYQSRYRPTSRQEVEQKLNARQEPKISSRSIGFLVSFIYAQIEYQRREAIRTVVIFCNQPDTSPERLRTRIKAYFDTSEKFSKGLLAMSETVPNANAVVELLKKIEGFDDVEHLYWETRRLLDERFRSDWAAMNLFAVAYRERAVASDTFMRLFQDMVSNLHDDRQLDQEPVASFLNTYLTYFARLDDVFSEELSPALLATCFEYLYSKYRLEFLGMIDKMELRADVRDYLHLHVAVIQLKEVTNAGYSQVIG